MSMKKRQTDGGVLLIRYFYLQRRMRYVCYQERNVKTARGRNFTPFMATRFILVAVNYYKTPFCFHDMRCDLLKLFINPTILFHLVLKHLTTLGFRPLRQQPHEERNKKTVLTGKDAERESDKRKPFVESGILQEGILWKIYFSVLVVALLACLCFFVYF